MAQQGSVGVSTSLVMKWRERGPEENLTAHIQVRKAMKTSLTMRIRVLLHAVVIA